MEVYVDGGIRHGSDVFKALALGARAVFLGRPIIYGLAYNVSIRLYKYPKVNADTLGMVGRGGCQTSAFTDQQGPYDNNDIGWYVSLYIQGLCLTKLLIYKLAFAGCTSIDKITRDYVAPRIPLSVRLLAGKL